MATRVSSGAPRLLRRERAAVYLDMSAGMFDRLVKDGVIPAPKRLGSLRAWDRDELDAFADHLPHDGVAASDAPSDWD